MLGGFATVIEGTGSMESTAASPRSVEVRVYRHGEQIHRELCESVDDAQAFIEEWPEEEVADLQFEVDDLSIRHRDTQVLDPEPEGVEPGGVEDERPR